MGQLLQRRSLLDLSGSLVRVMRKLGSLECDLFPSASWHLEVVDSVGSPPGESLGAMPAITQRRQTKLKKESGPAEEKASAAQKKGGHHNLQPVKLGSDDSETLSHLYTVIRGARVICTYR